QKGLLCFFPSFFAGMGFEMINPHDRAKRIGKNPIRMECVPAGSESRFGLLYVPFVKDTTAEVASQDLEAVTAACQKLMLELGFSAKKSSGYGAASKKLGKLQGVILCESLHA